MDFYHAVQVKVLNGQLFLAPIKKNPQRILDCGTGTGIWALDMGEVYPSAVVIGVDVSRRVANEMLQCVMQWKTDQVDTAFSNPTGMGRS